MARKKPAYINGTFAHRRTEADYMGVLLDAVALEDWRAVVGATVDAAKAGDATARAWLAQYLIGKPGATAPAPLTVVVQQLSGLDPVVEEIAKPHIDRVKYPALHASDDIEQTLTARVAEELRGLEAQQLEATERGKSIDKSDASRTMGAP